MIWIILLSILGVSVIGGIVAFATSGSKNSNTDNITEVLTTKEQENQITPKSDMQPIRTLYLNTQPQANTKPTTPMYETTPTPPMYEQLPVGPMENITQPYDDPEIRQNVCNLQADLQSLNSMLSTQQQIKKCEDENVKLEKENEVLLSGINLSEDGMLKEFVDTLDKAGPGEVAPEIKDLFKSILKLRELKTLDSEVTEIRRVINGIPSYTDTFVSAGIPCNYIASIVNLNNTNFASNQPNDTKRQQLYHVFPKLLQTKDLNELVKAVDYIIIQLSKAADGTDVNNLIVNGHNTGYSSLLGTISYASISQEVYNAIKDICIKLSNVQRLNYTRHIDDNNNNSKKNFIENRSITNKFLADDTHHAMALPQYNQPNNAKFGTILQQFQISQYNVKCAQKIIKGRYWDKFKVFTKKLYAICDKYHEKQSVQEIQSIVQEIQKLIFDEWNTASNAVIQPNQKRERELLLNYLNSMGIFIRMPPGVPLSGALTNCNSIDISYCCLWDKSTFDKLSKLFSNKQKIEENKKEIAQLNANISPSL